MDTTGLLDKDVQVTPPHDEITKKLQSLLPATPFRIKADRARELADELAISVPQLMMELVPIARSYNVYVPISNYIVGSCSMGLSGDLYLGMNLEFARQPLGQTVHSEQFTTSNAIVHGEKGLRALAVSAEPCGHCRQFLNEIQNGKDIAIFIPDKAPVALSHLLPRDFGPHDLGIDAGLMASRCAPLQMDKIPGELVELALAAANNSYAPYSNSPSGIAIRLESGRTFQGWYAENAAFNPTLPPLQMAIIAAIAGGENPKDIVELALVETASGAVTQEWNTKALLQAVAPEASCSIYYAKQA